MDTKSYLIQDDKWIVEYITQNGVIQETYRKQWEKANKENFKTIIKNTVGAILLNPDESKILLAYRKTCDRIVFPGWGIDNNETPIETIQREIKEETWYIQIKTIQEFTNPIQKNYFSIPKNINIKWTDQICIVTLNNLQKISVDSSEIEKHDMKRVDKDKVYNEINSPLHKLFWYRYLNKDRPLSEVDQEFIQLQQKKN